MGIVKRLTAVDIAREAIVAGLQSGSIKLTGTGRTDFAQAHGKADALYLATLFEELVTKLADDQAA